MTTDPFEEAYRREKEEERERRRRLVRVGLQIHATVYAGVNLLLFATWAIIWRAGGTAFPWFVFPLLGWGIGLGAHYVATRNLSGPAEVNAGQSP